MRKRERYKREREPFSLFFSSLLLLFFSFSFSWLNRGGIEVVACDWKTDDEWQHRQLAVVQQRTISDKWSANKCKEIKLKNKESASFLAFFFYQWPIIDSQDLQ